QRQPQQSDPLRTSEYFVPPSQIPEQSAQSYQSRERSSFEPGRPLSSAFSSATAPLHRFPWPTHSVSSAPELSQPACELPESSTESSWFHHEQQVSFS